ncbi:GRIP and coiled-coil domain-containing protein 2 [Rhinolophus sinicus]|uniref:GRIP and coiled-coil domain-containing protein 2 n=1 Tax=Rhinolophus sinicus TaxID=89399 RepID=UPI003D7AEE65
MEDPVQDGVASPATPGTGKSKLETLPKEDLIKFAKKQMMLLQKAKSRCTELEKEIEELKSKPGGTDIIKALTERLDAVLLEKAETEQQSLSLKKENIKMKQEVEDSVTKMEDMQKEFEQSQRSCVKEMENLKTELMAVHSKHSEDKANLQKELKEARKKQLEFSEQLKFQSDSEDNVKKLQEEIQKIRPAFEEQILHLQKQLEAATNEKEQEITHLQEVMEANSQHYQKNVNSLQEELLQLKATHQEEVKELMCQIEASAKEHEAQVNDLNQLKENLVKQYEESEKNIQVKSECELENEGKLSNANQENQVCSLLLQDDSFVEQIVNEKVKHLEDTLKEKDQKIEKLMVQLKTLSEDQEALLSEVKSLHEENNRLNSEKNQLSRDLEALLSQKEGCLTLKEHISELEKKLQLTVEERDNLSKLFENEQVQKLFVKTQLYGFLKQMESKVSEDDEEQDVANVLQAVGESLAKINEEKHNLVFQYDKKVVELEKNIKCLQEENIIQCEELRSLLRDYEQEKVLLRKELEETQSEKEALQSDLLEMKNANEKTRLENQDLLILVEEASQKLGSNSEIHKEKEKSFTEELENLRLVLEQKESELQDVRAELMLLKDSLEKIPSVENDQPSVKELDEKIEYLEKESKEKGEKINKIKLVAVKAKKELDSSRKEAQTLREELESVRSEKDQLSASMRDLIQGAESYKSLLLEYDKQSEQLDIEKERANNFEHHVEDLTRQLRNSSFQCEKLNSENEDLLARVETLQSNTKLLEVQILEVQKAKAMVDKELEAEKLEKEQKIKEHASCVNELEGLQLQLLKEKKQLQKTMQELELVKKDAQQTTLMNMEIADYERLMKELNQKLTNKTTKIEDLEQEIKIQKQKQETLQEEMSSLQCSLQQYEEKNTKIKQLLVKTKKELADSKQAETDHLMLQASLKGDLEASQQQVEVYKIRLAEITSEKHKVHEHLKTSAEQHQRTLSAYQQKVTALQEECRVAKAEQAAVTSEFESYKVRVHNVLKQQKNKSVSQAETEGTKQEREHLEILVDQLKIKLQDTQNNLQIHVSELQTLQSEHDTLLERHNKMLQETVSKEAELREKLCSVQSQNMVMKSEHAQTVSQLTSQNEALRNSFRDQMRHLQEEHRKTMETLQQQLSKVEAQLFQLKSEPTTRSPASSHQPVKNLRERRNTDLSLLDMHAVTREEGEGMETTDTESVSSAGTYTQSLEQLLNSPETKLEPPLWHADLTKEELVQKLSSTTKSADHLNGLLRETEATNAILMEQIKLLKSEIRRLERNHEREKSVANLEYLKNVLLQFIFLKPGSERERLLPVIDTMLQLSPEEKGKLAAIAQGEEENASRSSGWASYLHSWSGLR